MTKLGGVVTRAHHGVVGRLEKGSERGVAGHVCEISDKAEGKTGHECSMHEVVCGVVTKFQIRRGREQGGTVGVSYCTPHAGNSSRFFDQPGLDRIPLITRNRNGWQGAASLELSIHSTIGPVGSEDSD